MIWTIRNIFAFAVVGISQIVVPQCEAQAMPRTPLGQIGEPLRAPLNPGEDNSDPGGPPLNSTRKSEREAEARRLLAMAARKRGAADPPHGDQGCVPLELTKRQALILTIIYGAQKPLSATEIGVRLALSRREAPGQVCEALKMLTAEGVVRRIEKNARVVLFEPVSFEMPRWHLVQKGRSPSKGLAARRITANSVTILDEGRLTTAGRKVQNKHHGETV